MAWPLLFAGCAESNTGAPVPISTAKPLHTDLPSGDGTTSKQVREATEKTIGGATFTVPGEHDILEDDRKSYLNHYGKGTKGDGWYSFTAHGVHFIGLVNVVNLKGAGLGDLGTEQLEWLEKDVKPLAASTPIVVFAHIPLWALYPQWGWAPKIANARSAPHSTASTRVRLSIAAFAEL